MVEQPAITINGHEIREGETINRLGNVHLPDLHGTDPQAILLDAATEILQKIPDAVDEDDADALAARLASDPAYFDEIDGLTFHSMKVAHVMEGVEGTPVEGEVTFHDWKTGARETFTPEEVGRHLGTTLFLTK